MTNLSIVLAALVALAAAVPVEIPEPGQLAFVLNEDEFEDYLDSWLEIEEAKYTTASSGSGSGCTIRINGDLGEPQPVYLHNNRYPVPRTDIGSIVLDTGEQVIIACTGKRHTIQHPSITASVDTATVTCVNNTLVSGAGWLNGNVEFGELNCSAQSSHEAQATNDTCFNNNLVIRVGYTVNEVFYPLYSTCFDQSRLEVLYAWYEQNPSNAVHQTNIERPGWQAGSFFPGVPVASLYTRAQQKQAVASYVGEELAAKYVTSQHYLARGHLTAKTDYIYTTGQRATFYFINSAPQWQPINAGNWNWLEQNLRTRIGVAGYSTTIYTGTFGVTQLRDQDDSLVDIYLYRDANNNHQIPVPLYYYKVVYDASRNLGTAFVTINNPYYTEEEVDALTFCTDRCRNNTAFDWLHWQPDRIDIGYSFCCTIDDFRETVPHLPDFSVDDLLF